MGWVTITWCTPQDIEDLICIKSISNNFWINCRLSLTKRITKIYQFLTLLYSLHMFILNNCLSLNHLSLGNTLLTFLWFNNSNYLLYYSINLYFSCFSLFFRSFAICILWSSVAFSMLNSRVRFYTSNWARCLVFSNVCWSNILFVFFMLSFIWFFYLNCSSKYSFCSFWYYFVRYWNGWS
jgi:hypothetical protein